MKIKTITFTNEYRSFEVGERVFSLVCSDNIGKLRKGIVYVVSRFIPPSQEWQHDGIVYVSAEGKEIGENAEYVHSFDDISISDLKGWESSFSPEQFQNLLREKEGQ